MRGVAISCGGEGGEFHGDRGVGEVEVGEEVAAAGSAKGDHRRGGAVEVDAVDEVAQVTESVGGVGDDLADRMPSTKPVGSQKQTAMLLLQRCKTRRVSYPQRNSPFLQWFATRHSTLDTRHSTLDTRHSGA